MKIFGVCYVMCMLQQKTKVNTYKKSFPWTQNAYVIIMYVYIPCRAGSRVYKLGFQKNPSPG
jgi:hypothetical protein